MTTPEDRKFHRETMEALGRAQWRLDYLITKAHRILAQGGEQMAALDDLKAEVEKVKTVEASAVTLIVGLKQKLDEAIASGDPAALAALSADLDASATALADAVTANTPPAV